MQIVHIANWCTWLALTLCKALIWNYKKILSTALTFIWDRASASMKLRMMLKSWSSIEEVSYCFSRSSVKFQGHKGQISLILSGIERFRTVTPVWIHRWLWNDLESLKYLIVCQGHPSNLKVTEDRKSPILTQIERFWTVSNCSLNSPMGLKWYTKLDVVQKRCPIVFLGHPSNLKVTWTEKSMMWIQS